jgi:hypothetical protein
MTVGLVMASAALLIGATSTHWGIAAITVIAAVLFCLPDCTRFWYLRAAAAPGAAGTMT